MPMFARRKSGLANRFYAWSGGIVTPGIDTLKGAEGRGGDLMKRGISNGSVSRRAVLGSSALLPLAISGNRAEAALPPAPYKLSINIELMFPRSMPRDKRIEAVAAQGFRAYSFWQTNEQERAAMLEAQKRLGMK